MELTKEQLLKDGNWWLITTQYPVACTAAIYRVVQSDKDPVENMPQDEWSEFLDIQEMILNMTRLQKNQRMNNMMIGIPLKKKILKWFLKE